SFKSSLKTLLFDHAIGELSSHCAATIKLEEKNRQTELKPGGNLYLLSLNRNLVCRPSGKIYRVGFGEHDLSVDEGTEYYLDVESIHVHPYWNPSSLASGYDIALLKLKDPVYDNSYVEIAILPVEGQILPSQSECYITGWGLTSPNGSGATRLQQAGLSVVSYEICSRPEWWGATVNDRMICAGGDGYSSGCQGDSGGPFACKSNDGYWSVHGIVSFGPIYCNIYEKPTVFTRVSAYLDWIFQVRVGNREIRRNIRHAERLGHGM
uniref:Peptidase S1 domain-containing protein n=1 Tax=Callorhinchus milii TaxID=7868 RepID=A0A4W3IDP7_CALMI